MVHVNNLESTERSSIVSPLPDVRVGQEVQKLMREATPERGARAVEPAHLDFGDIYKATCLTEKPSAKVLTPSEKDFKPDTSYSTRGSREWLQKHNEQSQKPMELNESGKYAVKPGDSLGSIAERSLKLEGKNCSPADVQKRIKELEDINKDQFGNRDLIKPGMVLKIKPEPEDVSCVRTIPPRYSFEFEMQTPEVDPAPPIAGFGDAIENPKKSESKESCPESTNPFEGLSYESAGILMHV